MQQINAEYIGADVSITGANMDSRAIKPGQLFVAIRAKRDGHDYIDNAIEKGASALLVEKKQPHITIPQIVVKESKKALFQLAMAWRNCLKMPVITITGSCGKTTTKEMLACVLKDQGHVHYAQGNFNNELGLPLSILSAPDNCDYLLLELGTNAPGEIAHLATLAQPDIAGITNVSASHLEKLISLDGVMEEKGALLNALGKKGVAIINLDDPRIATFSQTLSCQKVFVTAQNKPQAGIHLINYHDEENGFAYTVEVDGQCYKGQLYVFGLHNLHNMLMVLGYVHALGLDIDKAIQSLKCFSGYKGRFSLHRLTAYVSLIDDTYNASVQSVEAAIESLSEFDGVRVLVLSNMGELGEMAVFYHQKIGQKIAKAGLDQVCLYGDQNLMSIMLHETKGQNIALYHDKRTIVDTLKKYLKNKEKTRILVKGSRANQMEEIVQALI